jgi:mono/diheme cytochrome c family protein
MKKVLTVVLMITLMAFTLSALAQTTVKQISVEWKATADLEGEALYNSLCSACHGTSGRGDGPAGNAVDKDIPDLTMIAFNHDGVYPHKKVQRAIRGTSRDIAHDTIDMPDWEQQFMYVRSGWSTFTREAYARKRVKALSEHIESLQVHAQPEKIVAFDR